MVFGNEAANAGKTMEGNVSLGQTSALLTFGAKCLSWGPSCGLYGV